MRRLLFLLCLTLLPFAPAAAQEMPDPLDLARYYPQETVVFAALRTDDAFFDQLDTLVTTISGVLEPYDVPQVSLRSLLALSGVNAGELLTALGDTAAVGITSFDPTTGLMPDDVYIVAELEDADAARSLLEGLGFEADGDELRLSGGTELTASFRDDLLVLAASADAVEFPPAGAGLVDNANFAAVVGALPAEAYNAVAYVDPRATLARDLPPEASPYFEQPGVALGLTILDGDTYTIDVAQLPAENGAPVEVSTVDPAFTRYIPAEANVVVHAANLTDLIERGIAAAERFFTTFSATSFGPTDFELTATPVPVDAPTLREQIAAGLMQVGIDLDADLLDWTTGDYTVFMRVDVRPLLAALIDGEPAAEVIEGRYDFALLVEATDPERAAALVARLTELLEEGAAASVGRGPGQEFTVGTDTVSGVGVTVIDADIALSGMPDEVTTSPIRLMLGSNDRLFFFGTQGAIVSVLGGAESLADTEAYRDAASYVLPDASSVWYTDGEGLIVGLVANPVGAAAWLTLLGSNIDNIFSNIVASLENDGLATPTPTPSPTPSPTPDVDNLLAPLDFLIENVRHSTMSTAVDADGVSLFRMTVTLSLP